MTTEEQAAGSGVSSPARTAEEQQELVLELSAPRVETVEGTRRATAQARLLRSAVDGSGVAQASAPWRLVVPEGFDAESLDWYLRRFPLWPDPLARQRAEAVEAALQAWGRRLHQAAWPGERLADGGAALPPHEAASAREAAAQLLDQPWELLHDGRAWLFQGPQAGSLRRCLRNGVAPPEPAEDPGAGALRVLSVAARPPLPAGSRADHRAGALALGQAVEALDGALEMQVLVPPTWAALCAELERAPGRPAVAGAARGRRLGGGPGLRHAGAVPGGRRAVAAAAAGAGAAGGGAGGAAAGARRRPGVAGGPARLHSGRPGRSGGRAAAGRGARRGGDAARAAGAQRPRPRRDLLRRAVPRRPGARGPAGGVRRAAARGLGRRRGRARAAGRLVRPRPVPAARRAAAVPGAGGAGAAAGVARRDAAAPGRGAGRAGGGFRRPRPRAAGAAAPAARRAPCRAGRPGRRGQDRAGGGVRGVDAALRPDAPRRLRHRRRP